MLCRLHQSFVLGMFLDGPWFGVRTLRGNYSSDLLFDTVSLTDPLMMLRGLISNHLPAMVVLTGTVIITVLYVLTGKQLFCNWVCLLNPIIDLANRLRRRFDLNQSATIPRHIRYMLLTVTLVELASTGTFIWRWVNLVSLTGRSLVMGFNSGALLILALSLFDLLVVEHGWCGHIRPVGVLYDVLGGKGVIIITATSRQKCNRCMDCSHAYPEPHVLRAPVLDEQSPVQITSRDRMTCSRCVDVCSEDASVITTRWSSGAKS